MLIVTNPATTLSVFDFHEKWLGLCQNLCLGNSLYQKLSVKFRISSAREVTLGHIQ